MVEILWYHGKHLAVLDGRLSPFPCGDANAGQMELKIPAATDL
jgi:hypothetical protein